MILTQVPTLESTNFSKTKTKWLRHFLLNVFYVVLSYDFGNRSIDSIFVLQQTIINDIGIIQNIMWKFCSRIYLYVCMCVNAHVNT